MKPVMEVCQPGVAGRSPRHGAGAGGGGHPGEGSGDGVPGGDGPPGVVDHGVVIVLPQLVVIIGKWLFHDFATEKKPFEAQQFYIVTKIVLYSCDVFLDYCEVNGLDGGLNK